MINFNHVDKKTFKDRLIYLCLVDMAKNDITSLLLFGFKGFNYFSEKELIESVQDRYRLYDDFNDTQVYKLASIAAKMTHENFLLYLSEEY